MPSVYDSFSDSIRLKQQCLDILPPLIEKAGQQLCQDLKNGAKIMIAGNGGSAADSQHFAAELINRFERERVPLPALALSTDTSNLTSIANDYHFDQIFSKQILALARPGDWFIAISTSGNSSNILSAITSAHDRQVKVLALTGRDGGKIAQLLNSDDVLINVPHHQTARVQEVHIMVLHGLCQVIDQGY